MLTPHLFGTLFLFFLSFKFLAKLYLNLRNSKHIQKFRHAVPEKFASKMTLEEHQKAADYSQAKLKLANISLFIDSLFLLIMVKFQGLGLLDLWARHLTINHDFKITGMVFFAMIGMLSYMIDLPMNLYQTFVLEEKFGFNKTTIKIYITDMIKQTILGLVIGTPVLYTFFWLMDKMGAFWWIYAWAFLTIFQLVMIVLYPVFIAPLFNKFSPLPEGELKTTILNLLERVDFSSNGLFVMDASKRSAHGNAYFTGLGKNKRIVFFDTLLKDLAPKEAEAVLAHELGHFKHKHILKSMIVSFVMSFFGMMLLGFLYLNLSFYTGHGVDQPSTYMALYLFSTLASLYLFPFTPFFTWKSRKNEFEADQFATIHSSGEDLIQALLKLYKANAGTLTPDPLYSKIYYSHPPLFERVSYIESLK
ncbi:MAG: M48 family metallopeptidase [Bacteriovoracaceae bacterium]